MPSFAQPSDDQFLGASWGWGDLQCLVEFHQRGLGNGALADMDCTPVTAAHAGSDAALYAEGLPQAVPGIVDTRFLPLRAQHLDDLVGQNGDE